MATKHITKTLVKNGVRREFSERAAKIAVNLLGWVEIIPRDRPADIKIKLPPDIRKPIILKAPPPPPIVTKEILVDTPKAEVKAEIPDEIVEPIKKTRKPRTKKA